MKNNKPDISLIRKYLNGELDASAMYQLERQAQDDPMLMDVMMGMEMGNMNRDGAHLAEIGQRIKNRVGEKRSLKLIPWKTWTVAASLIFALGFITFQLFRKPEEVRIAKQRTKDIRQKIEQVKPDTLTSQNEQKPEEQNVETSNSNLIAVRRKVSRPSVSAMADKSVIMADVETTDSVIYQGKALNEVAIIGYGIQRKSHITSSASTVNSSAVEQVRAQDALAGRIAGISMAKLKKTTANQELAEKKENYNIQIRGMSSLPSDRQPLYIVDGMPYAGEINKLDANSISSVNVLKDASATAIYGARGANGVVIIKTKSPPILVHGVIRDNESKLPIPGAAVYIKDIGKATYTDKDGKFTLAAPSKSEKLEVSMLGYERGQVKTKGADSLVIALLPSQQALNEVVVVGYGTVKTQKPEPVIGWKAYDNYLQEEATLEGDKEGKVTLAFTIGPDGTPSNLKVVKSDNEAMSKKAIDLITAGPKWNPGRGMSGKEIKLKIKFH